LTLTSFKTFFYPKVYSFTSGGQLRDFLPPHFYKEIR